MREVEASFSEIFPWGPSTAKANHINHAAGMAIGALIGLKAQALGANLFPGGLHYRRSYNLEVCPGLLQADGFITRGQDAIMADADKARR